jgi:hypothetical protein
MQLWIALIGALFLKIQVLLKTKHRKNVVWSPIKYFIFSKNNLKIIIIDKTEIFV